MQKNADGKTGEEIRLKRRPKKAEDKTGDSDEQKTVVGKTCASAERNAGGEKEKTVGQTWEPPIWGEVLNRPSGSGRTRAF